jgi:type IV secretion system protein VirB2
MRKNTKWQWVAFIAFYALSTAAYATGGDMPWDGPLQKFMNAITGPTATVIAILAFAGAAMQLLWGGEMSGLMKSMVYIIMVVGLVIGAAGLVKNLFGVSGALLGVM